MIDVSQNALNTVNEAGMSSEELEAQHKTTNAHHSSIYSLHYTPNIITNGYTTSI